MKSDQGISSILKFVKKETLSAISKPDFLVSSNVTSTSTQSFQEEGFAKKPISLQPMQEKKFERKKAVPKYEILSESQV